jgi:hypothetical protein
VYKYVVYISYISPVVKVLILLRFCDCVYDVFLLIASYDNKIRCLEVLVSIVENDYQLKM